MISEYFCEWGGPKNSSHSTLRQFNDWLKSKLLAVRQALWNYETELMLSLQPNNPLAKQFQSGSSGSSSKNRDHPPEELLGHWTPQFLYVLGHYRTTNSIIKEHQSSSTVNSLDNWHTSNDFSLSSADIIISKANIVKFESLHDDYDRVLRRYNLLPPPNRNNEDASTSSQHKTSDVGGTTKNEERTTTSTVIAENAGSQKPVAGVISEGHKELGKDSNTKEMNNKSEQLYVLTTGRHMLNNSSKKVFTIHDINEENLELIRDTYALDFEWFGYSLDLPAKNIFDIIQSVTNEKSNSQDKKEDSSGNRKRSIDSTQMETTKRHKPDALVYGKSSHNTSRSAVPLQYQAKSFSDLLAHYK